MKFNKYKRAFFEELWSWFQFLFSWIPGRIGHFTRGFFLGLFFLKKGKMLEVKENVEIWNPRNLIVGNNCGIGRNNIINCVGNVSLGNDVRLGPNVMITTVNHTRISSGMKNKTRTIRNVKLGNNIWVGNDVTILPGVEIGDNCVIAAGAVVTKSFPCNSVIAGIPGKKIN